MQHLPEVPETLIDPAKYGKSKIALKAIKGDNFAEFNV